MSGNSESFFYLVDNDGHARVPHKIATRDGRHGYAIHPKGKGNDASAADYTEDEKRLVQAVVLHGRGVRARSVGGPCDGQTNTVTLAGRNIRGYWLAPEYREWVASATQLSEQSPPTTPATSVHVFVPKPTRTKRPVPEKSPLGIYHARDAIRFAAHCCQGGSGGLASGAFTLDHLTIATEGARRLRFSPLGNRPVAPRVALVGITPGGQIERFATYLGSMDVVSAASRAAFAGAQSDIKKLLEAHGLAAHMSVSLAGDLNENSAILTTSIVKCCLMVEEGYRFEAPDIMASEAAMHCATVRFVNELLSYPTLKWIVIFGEPGWRAMHELRYDDKALVDVLRSAGLTMLQLPHFAQNFQQRALFVCDPDAELALLADKPDYRKFANAARGMRAAVMREVRSAKVDDNQHSA